MSWNWIKTIRFLGTAILVLADIIKAMSNILKFFLVIGICMGILVLTLMATFEVFHIIQPLNYATEYMEFDIFDKDIWAGIVAFFGWVTMLYGASKMIAAEKQNTLDLRETRENSDWV